MTQEKEKDSILERKNLKENPFGVPSGYFSSMQDEVMAKISAIPVAGPLQNETEEAAPAGFMTYFKPAFALAAMFGIIFGLGYGVMKITGTYTGGDTPANGILVSESPSDELSEDDVISIFNISVEDIFASQDAEATDVKESDISYEEIEQYLIDSRITATSLALLE